MSINNFGRLPAPPDGRDHLFLMRSAREQLKATDAKPTPRKRPYNLGPLLDQGRTPKCVAYGARSFLDAAPIMSPPNSYPSTDVLYDGAQYWDEWPGNRYDGSSTRGVCKFMLHEGIIKSYVWGQTVDEAAQWMIDGYGTVLNGTNWYPHMSDVDRNGFMLEPPTSLSTPIGGHLWHNIWYDVKKRGFLMKNSWGDDFGFIDPKTGRPSGMAYIRPEFLARLMREDGEMAAPIQVKVKPARP